LEKILKGKNKQRFILGKSNPKIRRKNSGSLSEKVRFDLSEFPRKEMEPESSKGDSGWSRVVRLTGGEKVGAGVTRWAAKDAMLRNGNSSWTTKGRDFGNQRRRSGRKVANK